MRRLLLMAMALGVLIPSIMWADEGRIPIFQPTTIAQSGHYIVTNDFTVAAGNGITISASNVVLDLNGRTITNTSSGDNIFVSPGSTSITIRHGRILGGSRGIARDSFAAAFDGAIEEVEIANTLSDGVHLFGVGRLEMISCLVTHTGGFAMYVTNVAGGATRGHVLANTILDGYGILFGVVRDAVIRDNVINVISGQALTLGGGGGGNLIEGNTLSGSGVVSPSSYGIVVGANNNVILNNVLTGINGAGISVTADGNRISGNVMNGATGSSAVGIDVLGAHNVIEENQIEGMGGCGINFRVCCATANAFRNNMLRGNGLGGVCGAGATNTDAGGNIL